MAGYDVVARGNAKVRRTWIAGMLVLGKGMWMLLGELTLIFPSYYEILPALPIPVSKILG